MGVPEQLAVRTVEIGTAFYRCHSSQHGAVYFGKDGLNRFDDPCKQFGVCYLSFSPSGAFAETLLRKSSDQVLQKSDLRSYCLTCLHTQETMMLVHCHGEGLKQNGFDSRIASCIDLRMTQSIARSLYDHAQQPDGLVYRARHDDDQLSIALFDRALNKLSEPGPAIAWMNAGSHLDDVLDRYRIALIDT